MAKFFALEANHNQEITSFELVIADGSNKEFINSHADLYKYLSDSIDVLSKFVSVKYQLFPDLSLAKRLAWLALNAEYLVSFVSGDDDLPLYYHLDNISNKLNKYSCVVGRYVNILGIKENSLTLSINERPYAGFSITANSPFSRFITYNTLNTVGIASTAYSLTSTKNLVHYTSFIAENDEKLYYAGFEAIHQCMMCLNGPIYLSDMPVILRDFTYWNYKAESKREAPEYDSLPYTGSYALELICNLVSARCDGISSQVVKDYYCDYVRLAREIEPSRSLVSKSIDPNLLISECLQTLSDKELSLAFAVWRKTLSICYNQ